MRVITLSISNWEKYNKRNDIKRPYWFALNNRFFEDPEFIFLDFEQKCFWLYILSQSSIQCSDCVKIYIAHASKVCGFDESKIDETISLLKSIGCLKSVRIAYGSVRNPNESVRITTATLHNITEQDTTEQNTTEHKNKKYVSTAVKNTALPTTADELIKIFDEGTITNFKELYPKDDYLRREALKAMQWCNINSRKAPKSIRGWKKFFTGWLERGWERERKNIQTKPAPKSGLNGLCGIADV